MRTRRIIWVLAALLSLGSLSAAVPTRIAPCAEVRPIGCLIHEERACERPLADVRAPIVFAEPAGDRVAPVAVSRLSRSLEKARSRFQRPPPIAV